MPVTTVVVVFVGAGLVVVVMSPVGAVELVDVTPVVVVVDDVDVVEDALDAVVVDVVVLVGVVAGAGPGEKRFFTEVPTSEPPKMVDSGLPEISSMAVTNSSASTNTMAAVEAMARHVMTGRRTGPARRAGLVEACRRSVAGASTSAEISTVSPRGAAVDAISAVRSSGEPARTTSVGAVDAAGDADDVVVPPLAPVPPSLRNNVAVSGAFTTTCFTASWPRSIDCVTKAVAMVAAAEPMATPMIVPLTPKVDATIAAITAPAVEARICRNENFTTRVSTRPQGARRRG